MNSNNYTFSFESSKSPDEVFDILLNVREWWTGLYGEKITGKSEKIGDTFSFEAGNGAHYSKQRLTELEPNKKIAWDVTESKLSFLQDSGEWTGTTIGFNISKNTTGTHVTFIHQGLIPKIECYEGCAGAWSSYLKNLAARLK